MSSKVFPGPKPWPVVGNIPDLLGESGLIQGLIKVGHEHGPVFRLKLAGYSPIFVTDYQAIEFVCDESKFEKKVSKALGQVRELTGDGLFTAHPEEENWHKAHNLLMPAFSLGALNTYYPAMQNVANQLVDRWENATDKIDVVDDMTRLTLETIGLCGFGYSFESFEREDAHPFINGMLGALGESMNRLTRPPWLTAMLKNKKKQFDGDISYLNNVVDEVIQKRKSEAKSKDDLLSLMLDSGELDDVNIRYQILTFLIAGHETTSGLLSFTLHYLLKHPEAMRKAQKEADEVLSVGQDATQEGNRESKFRSPTYRELGRFKYIRQALNEALRLWPTAPVFAMTPKEDVTLPGGFDVKKGEQISVLIPLLHRDKSIWGDNVELFDPDRFSAENEQARPEHAFKPFGNGKRACIGRQFAIQEATLAIAMILNRFDIIDCDNYKLKVKETLTVKPGDFFIKVKKRDPNKNKNNQEQMNIEQSKVQSSVVSGLKVNVFYGSQMGFTKQLATEYVANLQKQGIQTSLEPLNKAVNNIKKDDNITIFAASYNGQPTQNAFDFVKWIETLSQNQLKGVNFNLFGCGHKDWVATYQQVPKRIFEGLIKAGAHASLPLAKGDAREDILGDFEYFQNQVITHYKNNPSLKQSVKKEAVNNSLEIQWLSKNANLNDSEIAIAKILKNEALVANEHVSEFGQKHKLTLCIDESTCYETGGHLAVYIPSEKVLVDRLMTRLSLEKDDVICIKSGATAFPKYPIKVKDLLTLHVDLKAKIQIQTLQSFIAYVHCPPEKIWLNSILNDTQEFKSQVIDKHLNIVDILEKLPSLELDLALLLPFLKNMAPRYYSIASAKEVRPNQIDLIVSLVSKDGFTGLASNYLANLKSSDEIQIKALDLQPDFEILADDKKVIMIGAGTGVAPYLGFCEQINLQAIKPSVRLIYGCRQEKIDGVERETLLKYQKSDWLQLHLAQSKPQYLLNDKSQSNMIKAQYVQDVLLQLAPVIWAEINTGAKVFICGDAANMAQEVQVTLKSIAERYGNVSDSETWLLSLLDAKQLVLDIW